MRINVGCPQCGKPYTFQWPDDPKLTTTTITVHCPCGKVFTESINVFPPTGDALEARSVENIKGDTRPGG